MGNRSLLQKGTLKKDSYKFKIVDEMKGSVGVVIPVFNRPEMLERAVQSIQSKDGIDLQLVVVDDASTEDLSSVRSAVENAGHRWLSLDENSGPAYCRNAGVEVLSSDWVCFLDSDDFWYPGKLEVQLAWHLENPSVRISQVEEQWHRDGGPVKKPAHWVQKGGNLFADSIERCSIGPSCVMMRRDLWDETGGFDPAFRVCEDYELWLRITADEEVGLIPGGPLISKEGGHSDQLSFLVPAMDRFRVWALLNLLKNAVLKPEETQLICEGIRSKSAILAKGAEKRGKEDQAGFYRKLSATGDQLSPDEWLDKARLWCR